MSKKVVVAELEVGSGIEGPFQDAFEASFDPGEAALLRARAEGLVVLRRVLAAWKGTQAEKAQRLGIKQPSFNKVMKGDARRISLDYIIKLSGRAGVESRVSYHTKYLSLKPNTLAQ
jgi:predicted XRE-type DNA-binding protein